jgi:glycosyltransferase involved in cell wall biosynthesis
MVKIGAVVIGRNEGERLLRCLCSLIGDVDVIVYVDSGSTDGSVNAAISLGADAIQLDMSKPFTMARGRNAGLRRLVERHPDLEFVHFVDGDCELATGWIEAATSTLLSRNDTAIVCGQRKERNGSASVYNRLCNIEWHRPSGYVPGCGGDALMRIKPILDVDGYPEGMIAGEEGEMCFRLRARGWKIFCLPDLMTLHDAAMFSFSQWWRRSVRTGHAYAEGMSLHGNSLERYNRKPVRSALVWGVAMPVLTIALFLFAGIAVSREFDGLWLIGCTIGVPLALWMAFVFRVFRYQLHVGNNFNDAALYTTFIFPAKVAQCIGIWMFWINRCRGRRTGLIEYKVDAARKTPGLS